MVKSIRWNGMVPCYDKFFRSSESRPPKSGRMIPGSIFIKYPSDLNVLEMIGQTQKIGSCNIFCFTAALPMKRSLYLYF